MREFTNGEGVDVVLNTLSGPALARGLTVTDVSPDAEAAVNRLLTDNGGPHRSWSFAATALAHGGSQRVTWPYRP